MPHSLGCDALNVVKRRNLYPFKTPDLTLGEYLTTENIKTVLFFLVLQCVCVCVGGFIFKNPFCLMPLAFFLKIM